MLNKAIHFLLVIIEPKLSKCTLCRVDTNITVDAQR